MVIVRIMAGAAAAEVETDFVVATNAASTNYFLGNVGIGTNDPSVELHVNHPELGWMELGGSGIFRPELTAPLGVDVPVLAWGLGIDRMAMTALGISDIRQLFTTDLEFMRTRHAQ